MTLRSNSSASPIRSRSLPEIPGGFVDLQINGGWGHHFARNPEAIWAVGERLPRFGVTAFCPTLTSEGVAVWDRAFAVRATGAPAGYRGARPIGWHVEGPFLAPARAGAHDRSVLRPLTPEAVAPLRADRGVRLVTLAPDAAPSEAAAHEAIEALVEAGVTVSLGHTDIDSDAAQRAFAAGATMGTHLFNAMGGLHHRTPGLAAALLGDRCDAAVGLIADGHHVAPELVRLSWRLAAERIVLVSDAISWLGISWLGQRDEPVGTLPDGTLAGATVGIDTGVRNLARFAGISIAEAAAAASARPAAVIGYIPPDGDVTVIDDDGIVVETRIGC